MQDEHKLTRNSPTAAAPTMNSVQNPCASCTDVGTLLGLQLRLFIMPPSAVPDVVAASRITGSPVHQLDQLSLGKIVQIRERLLVAQAAGKRVYRFESGDPSFAPAAHVIDALTQAALAGKTHYIPNNGIPELRRALANKAVTKNGLTSVTADDIFVTNGAMHALYVTFGALLN